MTNKAKKQSQKSILSLGNKPLTAWTVFFSLIILILTLLGFNIDTTSLDKILYQLEPSMEIVRNNKPNGLSGSQKTGKVQRVIDGDTLELEDGKRVRYLMIDTPETKKPGTPVQCYGPEAFAFNKLMVENKQITMIPDKEATDKYGRELYFIFLNGANTADVNQSLNAELVKKGYARTVSYSPNTTYKKEFEALQLEAQKNKLGVWSSCSKPFEE